MRLPEWGLFIKGNSPPVFKLREGFHFIHCLACLLFVFFWRERQSRKTSPGKKERYIALPSASLFLEIFVYLPWPWERLNIWNATIFI
jgi:hypothetical protein